MWFWIAVTATVIVVLLVAGAVLGRRRGIHAAGPGEGYDVGLQGLWAAGHRSDQPADAGWGWGGGGGAGWDGAGWDGGDGGGGE